MNTSFTRRKRIRTVPNILKTNKSVVNTMNVNPKDTINTIKNRSVSQFDCTNYMTTNEITATQVVEKIEEKNVRRRKQKLCYRDLSDEENYALNSCKYKMSQDAESDKENSQVSMESSQTKARDHQVPTMSELSSVCSLEFWFSDNDKKLDVQNFIEVQSEKDKAQEISAVELLKEVDKEQQKVVEIESQEFVKIEPQEFMESDSQEIVEIDPQEIVEIESQEDAEIDLQEIVEIESQEGTEIDLQEIVEIEPQEFIESDSQVIVEIDPQEFIESDSQDIVEIEPQEFTESDSLEIVEIEPQEDVESDSQEIVEIEEIDPQEFLELELQKFVEMDPQEIVEIEPQEIVEIEPQEIVEIELQEIVKTEPQDFVRMESQQVLELFPNIGLLGPNYMSSPSVHEVNRVEQKNLIAVSTCVKEENQEVRIHDASIPYVKRYECTICNKRYTHRNSVYRHRKKAHCFNDPTVKKPKIVVKRALSLNNNWVVPDPHRPLVEMVNNPLNLDMTKTTVKQQLAPTFSSSGRENRDPQTNDEGAQSTEVLFLNLQ